MNVIPRNGFPSFSHSINYVTQSFIWLPFIPIPLYIQHVANSHLPCYHHVFPNAKKVKHIFKFWLKPLNEGITKCNTLFNSHFREGLYFNNLLKLRFYLTQNALKNHIECIKTKCIFPWSVLLKTLWCKLFTYI